MIKIPTLFVVDYTQRPPMITERVTPGCEWVINEEGIATRKWDGTACMVRGGKLYRRYDCKLGRKPPEGFEPCQEPDKITGHWPGWIPIYSNTPEKFYLESPIPNIDGTYELCGPKVAGNHEGFERHVFIKHGGCELCDHSRTFLGIKTFLSGLNMEGIVYHHPDGRMCKIRRKDFGFDWPINQEVK